MKMRDVLFNERLAPHDLPCYDKDPTVPSFVIAGVGATPYDQFPSYVVDGERVLTIPSYHRVHVPLCEAVNIERKILALVKAAAEHGSVGSESTGSPPMVPGHFEVVIKPPGLALDVPAHVKVIEHPNVDPDRFYCLTEVAHIGRMPWRPDVFGRIGEAGFLIFNPDGIRTVFVETSPKQVEIRAQA